MNAEQQLMAWIIGLGGWATITTIILILARRDVKMGLKKFFLNRFGRRPIKLRYHGADKSVTEYIIGTKGKGETIEIDGRRMIFIKTRKGSTFMLDEEAIRRCDDGMNEISYNYKSIMPLNPELSEREAKAARDGLIQRIKAERKERGEQAFDGVQMEELAQFTDPKRLNRLIEYVKLAAETEALLKMTDTEKYVKWTLFITGGTLIGVGLVWWTLDGQVIPALANILSQVQGMSAQVVQGVVNVG